MIYVGIDPGKSGGIGILMVSEKETKAFTQVYSDEKLIHILREHKDEEIRVCVEKVNAMPKQGVVSVFTFGKSAGFIEGVLQALDISYQLIRPQEWKKEFGLNSDKQASIDVCRKLFPDVDLKATERCRTNHDGKAEALLMAEFARRKL